MDSPANNRAPEKNLVLYFQVHQPKRLNNLRFFDIGAGNTCFNETLDRDIIQRISRECYLPANRVLLKVINKYPQVKVAFCLSGVLIDQLEENAPEVLDSFRELAETGSVEFLGETYYHSLACMIPGKEFETQVLKHSKKINEHFGVRTSTFRNTELIYNNAIGARVTRLGFRGIISDGVEKVLGDRSPNHVFDHPDQPLKVLLRNYRLSDDIAFRFRENGKTMTAEKYLTWLNAPPAHENVITLAMDYETFGEHQKKTTGIFKFLEDWLVGMAGSKTLKMATPAELVSAVAADSTFNSPNYISWADQERDLSAWLGNEMQRDAFDTLARLEFDIKNLEDAGALEQWRNLQISDHFYYMSTKKGSDGVVHNYFSPYASPYEAFINYMNVLTDFSMRVQVLKSGRIDPAKTLKEIVHEQPHSQSMGSRMTMSSTH
jgi:alpha-amylase